VYLKSSTFQKRKRKEKWLSKKKGRFL